MIIIKCHGKTTGDLLTVMIYTNDVLLFLNDIVFKQNLFYKQTLLIFLT